MVCEAVTFGAWNTCGWWFDSEEGTGTFSGLFPNMLTFKCDTCGSPVFFENIRCLSCNSILGIIPGSYEVHSVKVANTGTLLGSDGKSYRFCRNSIKYGCCNQLVPAGDASAYCRSCQFTEITPDLAFDNNRELWIAMEKAKRRLLFSLVRLGIAPVPKSRNKATGLAFRFLVDNSQNIMTGHEDGTITITLAEADDAIREARRQLLGEEYRTLLGHFRHEIGHFYWDRLIGDAGRHAEFRTVFGDERVDYNAGLSNHYAKKLTVAWKADFVSRYASSHPWEDWAETFAHFLHMRDVVETSRSVGLLEAAGGGMPDDFRTMVNQWLSTSFRLNELGRSIGSGDLYPFILTNKVIGKMEFIDRLISEAAGR